MAINHSTQKERHALSALRFLAENGPSTQIQLTQAGRLKRTSVFNLFEDMAERGLLSLNDNAQPLSGKGRPRQLWQLRGDLGCFLTVYANIHIRSYILTDFSGRQLASGTGDSLHQDMEQELDWIHELLKQWNQRYPVAGVMLVFPGRIDFSRGFVHFSRSWRLEKVQLRERLQAKLADIAPHAVIAIENNARMCAWGQRYGGACTGLNDYMSLIFVDGMRENPKTPISIGSSMVLNGTLYRGHAGGAGELDKECYRWYERLYQGKNHPVSLLELDAETRRNFARSLGESFAHLVNYLEPRRLAVIFEQSPAEDFFYALRNELYDNLQFIDKADFSIEISCDGISSTIRGGQMLLKSLFWDNELQVTGFLQKQLAEK